MKNDNKQILDRVQNLLNQKSKGKEHLQLQTKNVERDDNVIRVFITSAKDTRLEDYIHILSEIEYKTQDEIDQESEGNFPPIILLVPDYSE